MGLFRRKSTNHTESSLPFCERATELHTSVLFSDLNLLLAIYQLTEWQFDSPEKSMKAEATGVVVDHHCNRKFRIPAGVTFWFHEPDIDGDRLYGKVWKSIDGRQTYYRTDISTYDPDRRIYEAFQRAFEHAVMSGDTFVNLILHRKEKPHISDSAMREVAKEDGMRRLSELLKQVEAGGVDMPRLEFDKVAFSDELTIKRPS